MGTISRFETVNGSLRPATAEISPFEIVRGDRPAEPSSAPLAADLANGVAALRACRGMLEPLPVPTVGTVLSSLMAEFLARWPQSSQGEILRLLIKQANAALELLSPPPPPDTAA